MDAQFEIDGHDVVFPDRTRVSLENAPAMSGSLMSLFAGEPERAIGTLCRCALLSHKTGLPGLMRDYFDLAVAAGGTPEATAHELLMLGVMLEKEGDLEAAAECYGRAMHLPERDPFTWYFLHNNLGYCLASLGRFREAVPHCLAAVRIDPERHNAFKNLGLALQGLGKVDEAAGCFRQACLVDPQDERARRHLADLLFGGDVEMVPHLHFRRLIGGVAAQRVDEMVAGDGPVLEGRRVPLDSFDGMSVAVAEALDDIPGGPCHGAAALVWHFVRRGLPLDLGRAVERIVAGGAPEAAADALVNLAYNLERIDRTAEALVVLDRAGDLIPPDDHFLVIHHHGCLGRCLVRGGRQRDAAPHYREVLRLNPWSARAHRGLGIALLAMGEVATAEHEIIAADALAPGRPVRRLPSCTGQGR